MKSPSFSQLYNLKWQAKYFQYSYSTFFPSLGQISH